MSPTTSDASAAQHSGYVGLLGWTNVGKSTLLNRLVGTKLAAVANVSQTTRHRISGALTGAAGQIIFVDTPGLHRPRYRMNRVMVDLARQTIGSVDVVVLVVDAQHGIGPGDRQAAELLRGSGSEPITVLNKIDRLPNKAALLPMIERAIEELRTPEVVPISALTGENCDRLLACLYERLPEGPPLFPDDYLTDQPERVLAAEWIREKLLAETRDELPHATAVVVERWETRDDGLLEIEATILVERESQKPIVIGKGGEMLKRVGTAARLELESFLDRPLFVRLWVKVRRDWRNDTQILRSLGLN